MEHNPKLYWQQFSIWIVGGMISFLLAGTFGVLYSDSDPEVVPLVAFAILFFPFIPLSLYGLICGYCMSYRLNHIRRGRSAIARNFLIMALYPAILIFVVMLGPENLR